MRLYLPRIRSRVLAGSLGAISISTLFASSKASAQTVNPSLDGLIDVQSIDGLESAELQADGSVRLRYEDGAEVVIEASDLQIVDGQIFLAEAALAEAASAQGLMGTLPAIPTQVLAGGVAAGGGLIALTASGGSGSENQPPSISSSASISISETSVSPTFFVEAIDPENDAISFEISGGADADLFEIDGGTGEVRFRNQPDFENPSDNGGDNTYELTVTASDGQQTVSQQIIVTVTDENDTAPVFTNDRAAVASENERATSYIATATDAEGDAVSFTIVGGDDANVFVIDAATGVLSFVATQDFEAPGDADGDGVYHVVVQASDGTNSTTQSVAVTLEDVDEAPVITSAATASFEENASSVAYTTQATDPEGRTLSFAIDGGADASSFLINEKTGELEFRAPPDFEALSDADGDNVFDVIVSATDGTTSTRQAIEITVTDVDDRPVFNSATAFSVDENIQGTVFIADAADPLQNTVTYSISGGTDADLFNIDQSTGAVSFISAPNFESPVDDNSDNVFDLEITASSGGNIRSQDVTITVEDIDEAPVFTTDTNVQREENKQFIGTVGAIDPEGSQVSFQIVGGDDGLSFSIDPSTGQLFSLIGSNGIDYDAFMDQNGDNVFEVGIQISDGTSTTYELFFIEIENVNDESPVITSSTTAFPIPENTTGVLGVVPAIDPDGSEFTYSISGDDAGIFSINADTGELSIVNPVDFENPTDTDQNNVYNFDVTVSDGDFDSTVSFAMEVTNVNDVIPTFPSGGVVNVVMNEGTVITGFTAQAVDNVEGDPVRYSLREGAGDNSLFVIDPVTGVLLFDRPPDFEAPTDSDRDNEYGVFVVADDGSGEVNQFVSITVTDIVSEQAPVFTSPVEFAFVENSTFLTFSAFAQDPQNDSISFSISGGPDSAFFGIRNTSLNGIAEVFFQSSPDFETPADANGDNVYEIELTATDGTNDTVHLARISVLNVNDNSPVFAVPATVSFDENRTEPVFLMPATDADNDPLTYSLGGVDASSFSIDPSSGALSFLSSPDFESPADSNGDNTYSVTVEASDGRNSTISTFDIVVTNANDNAPEILSPLSFEVGEGTFAVAMLTANDLDNSTLTWSIDGGIDRGEFEIDQTTGALSFEEDAPDFENPADADQNNDYELIISVSDGVFTDTQRVTVVVNDRSELGSAGPGVGLGLTTSLSVGSSSETNGMLIDLSDEPEVAVLGSEYPLAFEPQDGPEALSLDGWPVPLDSGADQLTMMQTDNYALWA